MMEIREALMLIMRPGLDEFSTVWMRLQNLRI